MAVYIYLQPLIAFTLAPLINETWNSRTWVASLLIFAGVATVSPRENRKGIGNEVVEGHERDES